MGIRSASWLPSRIRVLERVFSSGDQSELFTNFHTSFGNCTSEHAVTTFIIGAVTPQVTCKIWSSQNLQSRFGPFEAVSSSQRWRWIVNITWKQSGKRKWKGCIMFDFRNVWWADGCLVCSIRARSCLMSYQRSLKRFPAFNLTVLVQLTELTVYDALFNWRVAKNIFLFILKTRLLAFNPLSAGIFTVFRVLHKEAWVATLLGALLGVQDYKKVKFLC